MKDVDIIRQLASEIRVLGSLPIQQERARLWRALNDLHPERPMVWITEIPWGEFENQVPELQLMCVQKEFREVERAMRHKIFTARHLECDEVVEPFWRVQKIVRDVNYGVATDEEIRPQGESDIVSHRYKPVIRTEEDIEKVRMPQVTFDRAATERRVAQLDEWFGDILPVRVTGVRYGGFHPWDDLITWTGVSEALEALYDRPKFLHAVLRRMTDSHLACLDQLESLGLLESNVDAPRVGSGGAGYTAQLPSPNARQTWRAKDLWGFATAQIFADVSPEMHEEFARRYEIEVLSRFGLNYYGCCEPLHTKMRILAQVPRLRKVSISPWCDVRKARAEAPFPLVFSHKPSPAILANDTYNGAAAEAELRKRLEESEGMPSEIIMKDISTVRGDVTKLIEWCRMASRIAREAAA